MATKIPDANQHLPLHDIYGDDCCLCKAEARAEALESELAKAKQEIAALVSDDDDVAFLEWKQERAEREKKQGQYWLSAEGRKEIREIWPKPYGQAIPPVLLDALEQSEARIKELEHSVDEVCKSLLAKQVVPCLDAPSLGER
jgi:hypothetical protein